MLFFLSFNLELSLDSATYDSFFLWHDWCIEGFPLISYLHLILQAALVSVRSYICLYSCVRCQSSVFWTGFLCNSFPGCQLSLLFSLQHAWLLCFAEDAPLRLQRCFQEEVSSWGTGLIFLPTSYREEANVCYSLFWDYLREHCYWTSRRSSRLWPMPDPSDCCAPAAGHNFHGKVLRISEEWLSSSLALTNLYGFLLASPTAV